MLKGYSTDELITQADPPSKKLPQKVSYVSGDICFSKSFVHIVRVPFRPIINVVRNPQ